MTWRKSDPFDPDMWIKPGCNVSLIMRIVWLNKQYKHIGYRFNAMLLLQTSVSDNLHMCEWNSLRV